MSIAILAECDNQPLVKTKKIIGGDLGLKFLLNLSDGDKVPLIRYDKAMDHKLYVWERKVGSSLRRLAKNEITWDHHDKIMAPRTFNDFKNH